MFTQHCFVFLHYYPLKLYILYVKAFIVSALEVRGQWKTKVNEVLVQVGEAEKKYAVTMEM